MKTIIKIVKLAKNQYGKVTGVVALYHGLVLLETIISLTSDFNFKSSTRDGRLSRRVMVTWDARLSSIVNI